MLPGVLPRQAECPGAKEPAMPRQSKDTIAVLGIGSLASVTPCSCS